MTVHVESVEGLPAILQELRRTRAEAVERGAASVATMNFIVFVDDPSHRPWVLERAALVVEKHPARLLVLDSTELASGIDFSSSSREAAGMTMVSERIDIAVRALGHAEIASLAQELTVHGLPTVLWWSGAKLLRSRTFAGLAAQAGAVVVDSSGMASGDETVRELGAFVMRYPDVALHDLAFLRLGPWMDMIAQFFDDASLRDDLFSIEALHIESGSEAEALYLAGWLASRLSWEALDHERFRARGRTIRFSMVEKGDKRRVRRVELKTDESSYTATLHDEDENVVCQSVEGANAKPTWCVPLQSIDNASLIERAILKGGHDPIFESSLATVRDMLG